LKAQIAEGKAGQAKRRFASYIFHEVRVPLNTASAFCLSYVISPSHYCTCQLRIFATLDMLTCRLFVVLAYQNLQGSPMFKAAADANQGVEIYALEASLTMMQQVGLSAPSFGGAITDLTSIGIERCAGLAE
jgi:hypothetical protein